MLYTVVYLSAAVYLFQIGVIHPEKMASKAAHCSEFALGAICLITTDQRGDETRPLIGRDADMTKRHAR